MQFPNALKGVKKIFTAEILALIAGAVGVITAILIAAETEALVPLIAVLGIGVLVVSLISFILNILGLNDARKDEVGFSKAFFIAILGVIISLVAGFLSENTFLANLLDTLGTICEVLVTIFVIGGIMNLAAKLNDEAMVAKGRKILAMVVTVWVISILAALVATFLGGSDTAVAIAGILFVVSSVVEIIAYILYLIYLAKAKKMLEA